MAQSKNPTRLLSASPLSRRGSVPFLLLLGGFFLWLWRRQRNSVRFAGMGGLGAACDVKSEEDLAMAAMNLIALEEHLFFTYQQTQDEKYLEKLNQARDARRALMKKLNCGGKGETWCASKHLLSATMRLFEVGNKYQIQGDMDAAKDCYAKARMTYDMFWENKKRG